MNKFILILTSVFALLSCSSCHKDEPELVGPTKTVLIYAVASNNLSSYLKSDMEEMKSAAPSIRGLGEKVRVLLYSVASKDADEATLAELLQNPDKSWDFQTIKHYDRNTFSTDPKRISQVISDMANIAPADGYGLIFWSHATGWLPNFNTHQVPGVQKSFGWDTYLNVTDKCDIIELADAIPDRMFDYIWFDCCYMMTIESVYQLRNKCGFIGGYPTEDWNPGMNYDETLPMLASPYPDLKGSAKAFFDYYNNSGMAVTVSLIETKGLENLAAAASDIYEFGRRPQSALGFQDYGRPPYRGLYDFGQFTRAYLPSDNRQPTTDTLLAAFNEALDKVLVYGGCSSKDFNGNPDAFDPDIYSGMSCHFPNTGTSLQERYYLGLDWTRDTNP